MISAMVSVGKFLHLPSLAAIALYLPEAEPPKAQGRSREPVLLLAIWAQNPSLSRGKFSLQAPFESSRIGKGLIGAAGYVASYFRFHAPGRALLLA